MSWILPVAFSSVRTIKPPTCLLWKFTKATRTRTIPTFLATSLLPLLTKPNSAHVEWIETSCLFQFIWCISVLMWNCMCVLQCVGAYEYIRVFICVRALCILMRGRREDSAEEDRVVVVAPLVGGNQDLLRFLMALADHTDRNSISVPHPIVPDRDLPAAPISPGCGLSSRPDCGPTASFFFLYQRSSIRFRGISQSLWSHTRSSKQA